MKRAALLVLIAAAACRSSPAAEGDDEDEKPVPVVCEAAQKSAVADTVSLRGVVGVPPDKDAVVAPAVAGRLLEVEVHEGDRVKVGDPIATVDDPALAPAVREAEAARAAAVAGKVNADAALVRAKRLLDQGIAPRRDVEDADARAASAAAEVAAADARLEVASRQLGRARVTAPIAGVIIHVTRRAGELVDGTPATPVAEVADSLALEIKADAPAADLVKLREGALATIKLDALPERALEGKVVLVSPAVDPATSLGTVRVSIAAPADDDVQLKLGLAGSIAIAVAHRTDAITVPAAAVRRSTDGAEEVVACEKNAKTGAMTAAVVPVKVGSRNGDRVEITEGVVAGRLVVVRHVVGLDDGTPLEVGK